MPVHDAGANPATTFTARRRTLPNGLECLDVEGELDVSTAPVLRQHLNEVTARGQQHLVLDFTRLRYMDSTGLGVLVGALKQAREHQGRVMFICMDVRIQKLFSITGLSRVFDIFQDESELLQKCAVRSGHPLQPPA